MQPVCTATRLQKDLCTATKRRDLCFKVDWLTKLSTPSAPNVLAVFEGWVPTVSGRLSFSIAGESNSHGRVVHSHSLHLGSRFFVCYQKRYISDTTIPFLTYYPMIREISDWLFFGRTGKFTFIAISKISQDREYIRGFVGFMPYQDWKKKTRDAFRARMDKVNDFGDTEELYPHFMEQLSQMACTSKFIISRDGYVKIEISSIEQKALDDFRDAQSLEILYQHFASHVYFFIRELFHTHKYHGDSSDTILDIYSQKWKENIVHTLLRRITLLRRERSVFAAAKAKGILSYLESFLQLHCKDEKAGALRTDLSALSSSLDTDQKLSSIQEKMSGRYHIKVIAEYLYRLMAALILYTGIISNIKKDMTTHGL